jgi:riboflavin kinase / FMN adenylyltransferase
VVIGHDFFFGKGRSGTPEIMREAAQRLGFGLTVIAPVAEEGEVFSSSAIRLRLAQGDVKGAAAMLGRWWRAGGKVIGGAKRGAGLGFPTANVPLARGTALGHGIYAVRVFVAGKRYDGAAYLGTRPTYDNGMPVLEVFLFGFEGDLYGRDIEVEFIDFVREDRKFASSEELIAQMQADCAKAAEILASAPATPGN